MGVDGIHNSLHLLSALYKMANFGYPWDILLSLVLSIYRRYVSHVAKFFSLEDYSRQHFRFAFNMTRSMYRADPLHSCDFYATLQRIFFSRDFVGPVFGPAPPHAP